MNWRYLGLVADRQPLIFWVEAENSARVGMAGLIFRPYRVNGTRQEVGVLGDISLNRECRGLGVGYNLFQAVNAYLQQEGISGVVIPNQAAEKSLVMSGWIAQDRIVQMVYLLNPYFKLMAISKSKSVATFLGKLGAIVIGAFVDKRDNSPIIIKEVSTCDKFCLESFCCIRDRYTISIDKNYNYLQWRYNENPNEKFKIIEIKDMHKIIGYIVFMYRNNDNSIVIYEIIINDYSYLCTIIIKFVNSVRKTYNINCVRFPLNKNHPYVTAVIAAGFVPRKGSLSLLVLPSADKNILTKNQWLVTAGDKDV